jgi:diketogulonate reductase-like aldo/keto reductase
LTAVPQIVGANGLSLPALGLGTYGMTFAELSVVMPAVLDAGLRHIDTAQIYRNEDAVGDLVAASNVPRADLFLTTKVWIDNYPGRFFAVSVDESLKRLRTDYIDLLLLHWPSRAVPLEEQIAGLVAAVKAGKARHIGVSNFTGGMVAEAARLSSVPLATNQFEYHPYLNQKIAINATRQTGLSVTAYCAMAVGRVFDEALLKEIASAHHRSVAQVVLRWVFQQDIATLTRSTNVNRIADNIRVFDFALSDAEMDAITALADPKGRIVNPPGLAPDWDPTPAIRV